MEDTAMPKIQKYGEVLMTQIIMATVSIYLPVWDNLSPLDFSYKEYMSEAHRYWQFSNDM
jgi:hypothetical protein